MRGLGLLMLPALVLSLVGCEAREESYSLPDIRGKSIVDAIVSTADNITLNPIYVGTNELLPNMVLNYKDHKAGDLVNKGDSIAVEVAKKPSNAKSHDPRINYVSEVAKITGPDSINKDPLLESGIYGTDLGIPVKFKDETILLFGDSFSGPKMSGMWKSNFLARSTDKDLYDGISFDVVTNSNGAALPFCEGRHMDGNEFDNNVEVTKIPTGGIEINGTMYVFYMSIRYWGVAGSWKVNYNQCLKSKDLKSWSEVKSLRFSESEAQCFGQIYPYKDEKSDYIYLYGIPGGRNGGCVLGRVKEDSFENREEIEYLIKANTWKKGNEGLASLNTNPYYVAEPGVSELSVSYNEYLGKYMMSYVKNSQIIIMTSNTPYSKFKDPIVILKEGDYNGIYGGFICPGFVADGGKSIYLTISSWADYNVYLVKAVFN